MTEPVQLQYITKDGAERIVLLPTIDIHASDMVSVIAGVVVAQHDTIRRMQSRLDALEAATTSDIEEDAPEPEVVEAVPESEAEPEVVEAVPESEAEPEVVEEYEAELKD